MRVRILFAFLAISPMTGLCENGENVRSEITSRISDKGGFEIRVIAEKHQSAKNGLIFSVELENKLGESVSFVTLKKDKMQTILKENDVPFRYTIQERPQNTADKSNLASYNNTNKTNLKNVGSEIAGRILDKDESEIRVIAEKHQSAENGLMFSIKLDNKFGESVQASFQNKANELNLASYNDNNKINLGIMSITRRIDIDADSTVQLGTVEFSNYYVDDEVKDGEFVKQTIAPGIYIIKVSLLGQLNIDPPPGVSESFWRAFAVDSKPVEVVLE